MPMAGTAGLPADGWRSPRWTRRQRRRLRGAGSAPAGAPAEGRPGRRRTREQRRNRRSAAFDLLAVAAALALVGLGLANLYLIGETELAARQGAIAVAGVLALAVCWRFRVRYLDVLGWVAYGA